MPYSYFTLRAAPILNTLLASMNYERAYPSYAPLLITLDLTPIRQTANLHSALRRYFEEAGFLEAATPILSPYLIPEEHIELFETRRLDINGDFHALYLVPSPEIWMKLLLADGAPSMYQIARCFRNGEQWDSWHRWEFTMLEWYELDKNSCENIPRMMDILTIAQMTVGASTDAGVFRTISMEQAFSEFAGFSLEADLVNAGYAESPSWQHEKSSQKELCGALRQRLKEQNLPTAKDSDSPADLFHRLFISLVEDRLPVDQALFLTDWPALIPTLARRKSGTPWADRWEMYYKGVEVANCYGEENDRAALMAYWENQNSKKSVAAVPMNAPSDWPAKIAAGMPVCSGAAVGLDRLLALVRGDTNLNKLDIFS